MSHEMIAVTVVTPSYKHLEKECVRRIKKFTGLPVKVIRCSDKHGFMAKLELDKKCGSRRILFVDVDYYFLRPFNPLPWDSKCWFAVHDSAAFNPYAFPHKDCVQQGMNKAQYFNSGMFVCDLRLKEHRNVFVEARRLKKLKRLNPVDVTDQFYLNKAVQGLRTNLSLLPTKFNFYLKAASWGQLPYIPRDIVGIHAAGEPLKYKASALRHQCKVFGQELLPMCREVVEWEFVRLFEFR